MKKQAADARASDEARFWSLIERAWATQPNEVNQARMGLANRDEDSDDEDDFDEEAHDQLELVEGALPEVIEALENECTAMEKDELAAMDRVLERKLFEIDRREVQEATDGSDDGFLYARGFIVALGEAFYRAVDDEPSVAIMDSECEELCYLTERIYEKRFGAKPESGTGFSRETGSNSAGWAG